MKNQVSKSYTYLLFLIIVIGLVFRLWGIMWGLNSTTALHPDEQGDCTIIYQMIQGDFSQVGLETWYFVYNYCIAIVYVVINKIAFLFGIIFSFYKIQTEVDPDMVLIGRITSVIFSTLNIWLLYFLGKRIFQNRHIGLMAAALFAVTPLSVAQAHYLEMDSPLAFMATLSFMFSYFILTHKRSLFFALGGLFFGLTFTTKPNGILTCIPFFISFCYLFFDESFKKVRISLLKRILLFITTSLAGFVIGAPGLFVNFPSTVDRIFGKTLEMAKQSLPWTGSWIEGPQGSRFAWAIQTLMDGFGGILILITIIGITYHLLRKNKEVLMICSFPIGYFFLVGLWGRRFGERDVVVMIPFLALMAAAFFYKFLHYWYSWRFKKTVMTILFLGLLVWPTWKTIEIDYYYWLDDNRDLAEKWLNQNLPSESVVALDGYTPYSIKFSKIDFEYLKPIEYYKNNCDFLVISSLEGDRYFSLWTHRPIKPEGENLLSLQRYFTLIKEFDLKHQETGIEKNGSLKFPDFLDPALRVYSTKAGPIKHKISFPALIEDADSSYKVVFLNHPEYEKSSSIFVVKPYSEAVRVLRTTKKLKQIQLIVYSENQAKVKIKCGSAKKERQMESGQIEILEMEPSPAFPFIKNIYQLKAFSQSKGNLYVKWVADPVEMGLNRLRFKQPKKAVQFFETSRQQDPENLESLALLGSACFADGKKVDALNYFKSVEEKDPFFLSNYFALAKSTLTGEAWLKLFCDFTGFYLPLIQIKSTHHYVLPDQCTYSEKVNRISKEGFIGEYNRGDDGLLYFKLWSRDVFPQGFFNVHFRLSAVSSAAGVGPALRVDILKHTPQGFFQIAEKVIDNNEIQKSNGGLQNISFNITNDPRVGQFEFRVFSFHKEVQFIIKQVDIYLDLKKAMEENMKQILSAMASTYQAHADYKSAIDLFQKLFNLSPDYNDVGWNLGNLLIQTGHHRDGMVFLKKYEALNQNNPSKLKTLYDRYQKINEPVAAEVVKKRIDNLPFPQTASRAVFSGKIQLMGYSLEQTKGKGGDILKGSLFWKGLEKMDLDYDVFLHVLKNDQMLFQGHLLIQEGEKTLDSLIPGEIIKKDFQIKIPADITAGTYKIYLGLWDSRYSERRLKISYPSPYSFKDKFLLTTITID